MFDFHQFPLFVKHNTLWYICNTYVTISAITSITISIIYTCYLSVKFYNIKQIIIISSMNHKTPLKIIILHFHYIVFHNIIIQTFIIISQQLFTIENKQKCVFSSSFKQIVFFFCHIKENKLQNIRKRLKKLTEKWQISTNIKTNIPVKSTTKKVELSL